MRLSTLVGREIFERKSQLATSFLAILLGITVIVSIKNITVYSEKAVAREMDSLGANVLVLPKTATLQDYYKADMQGDTIPEEYVTQLALSNLEGLDNLSPKLSVPVVLQGKTLVTQEVEQPAEEASAPSNSREQTFTLTGILPKSEFQAKAAWQGAGIFSRPAGCGAMPTLPFANDDKKTLVRQRVIENLENDEVLVGADVASAMSLKEGDGMDLLGQPFKVTAVLPQTGTIDDSRIFAHLHRVQEISKKDSVINAIEIVGCCQEISKGLVAKINKLLPDAKVVTITQIADAQIKMNKMMSNLSMIFLAIIVVVGGAGIANYMYANVYERRKEIGTLMALGANSSLILRIFLLKALLLGLVGGVCGYLLGTVLAVTLGPKLAGVPVLPMPLLALWAIGISIGLALLASFFPARRASKLDPCATFQEI
jgi:putative ABC transport system permease protein